MATYYVGIGGNDGNSGLTWALRKLTLNGAEDTPVVASDVVYVGPGVYREMLTVDVSGGAGANIITYIADVTGEHTDGVGGIVRVTGSDNDTSTARAHCITADGKDYRTFRGFFFNFSSDYLVEIVDGAHWIIEDCVFSDPTVQSIYVSGADQLDITIRRCLLQTAPLGTAIILFTHAATVDNTGHLVENCLLWGAAADAEGITSSQVGGITIRNCDVLGCYFAIRITTALTVGQTVTVNNCIIAAARWGFRATVVGEIIEDYNTLYLNGGDRFNTNIGANSQTYPPIFLPPILHSGASQISGFQFPWWFCELSEWSAVRAITGSNEPTGDLWGIVRPTTAAKNSWGAEQFQDRELESGTVQAGTYSRVLHDAGSVLVRRVPITGAQITVSLYMYREANYAGNLPWMVIKQPGVADRTTIMTAAVSTWEQLSDTFTPASPPGFIEVWAESRNTAVALAYEVFYDTMKVR